MRLAALSAALVAMALALLAGCASQPAPRTGSTAIVGAHAARAAAQKPTVVSTLVTYRADGSLAVPTVRTLTGSCFTSTVAAAPSPKGYRCVANHSDLFDPCIPPPDVAHPTAVACRADPWSGATVLRLTAALPKPDPSSQVARPWAMQLADGERCVAVTGTVSVAHGVALAYRCADGSGAGTPAPGPTASGTSTTCRFAAW